MIDLTGVKHHPAINEIVEVLCNRTQRTDRGFFQPTVAYFLCKMAATMRATISTQDRGDIPVNSYVIALATSGFGKGHSVHIMENMFFRGFERRFMDNTFSVISEKTLWDVANKRAARDGTDQQEEFDKAEKDWKSAGPYLFTFDSGTSPAVKQLRNKLLLSGCGSINFQMDELGSNLEGNTELLNLFLELYDQGIVKEKLVKNSADNKRFENLKGKTPSNMLLFGTPAKLFDGGKTEDSFYSFLDIGYARRCLFGLGQQEKKAYRSKTPEEIFKDLTDNTNDALVSKWSNHFHALADPGMFEWTMTVDDSVSIKLLEYMGLCEDEADKLPDHEEIRKAELSHRYFKALKLAGAYAFVDQSHEVEMDHLLSAILLVEESGSSFQKILKREKNFVKLAKFIASAEFVEPGLSHAELTDKLPYYKTSSTIRNELMGLAMAWGYKNHIIIKKQFVDGLEFFKGETLKETSLDELIVSYSDHWAYNYGGERVPFEELHKLTQAEGMHWANHHFRNEHRSEENVIERFNTVVIDVDHGVSLETAHELLKDYKFLTYTTKRHTEEENRFRLILPINYELDLSSDDYREFMNSLMDWLPFPSDEAANQRSKKWESFAGGSYHYNHEGEVLDILPFIPKTSKNEQYRNEMKELASLDNLERWFAQRMVSGNRNNHMIKFALALVDGGMDLITVQDHVHSFNKKLSDPLSDHEINSTIMVTVAKRYQAA